MKCNFALIFLFCFLSKIDAQNNQIKKIQEANPNFKNDVYEFPILSGTNSDANFKINSFLIKDQLDVDYGKQSTSIFENVWRKPEDPVAPINYLSYKVENLSDYLYSVTISGEWCGAYCEGYESTYNFDLKSGDLVTLDLLFTENSKELLLQNLQKFKYDLISDKIKELSEMNSSDTTTPDMKEANVVAIDMYENCGNYQSTLSDYKFIPFDDEIIIIGERCSLHYNRDLDDLWYFVMNVNLTETQYELSPYGKKILNVKEANH